MNTKALSVDYLLIGQGLAGTNLAYALLSLGARVHVIDAGHEEAASRVAAGLLNPVTGQRMSKSWQVDEQLPFAREYYRTLEKQLECHFFQERRILRLMRTEAEVNRWEKRKSDPAYESFLGDFCPAGSVTPSVEDLLGGCFIEGVASLETEVFLQATREDFLNRGLLTEGLFDADALTFNETGLRYGHFSAKAVVFCQGWKNTGNPWFGSLPFKHAKGEILKAALPSPAPAHVISREKWILPLDESRVRVGSTYDWERLNCQCTEPARKELLKHLRSTLLLEENPIVLEHSAGVRPCSHDTKPYMGYHPNEPRVAIFNGFGSKGALMTPLCASRMAEYLIHHRPLEREESLTRLGKKGWPTAISSR